MELTAVLSANQNAAAIQQQLAETENRYRQLCEEKLSLDLTRGKPSAMQLDLSNGMEGILGNAYSCADGDSRNYGDVLGTPEARKLGGELLGMPAELVLAGGSASLQLMFLAALHNHQFGANGPESAWSRRGKVRFLCPVPGYDRHFTITETLGIEMLNVPMTDAGPDMDQVEAMVKADASIVGMWCVPKYANPTGCVYSDECVDRIAALGKIAAPGFRVFWDNAYGVHDLTDNPPQLASLYAAAVRHGTVDNVWQFTSTSKITFAGAGISWAASSAANLKSFAQFVNVGIIGFDRVNQLRHVRFLRDLPTIMEHMQGHRQLIAPKFALVQKILNEKLSAEYGSWTSPQGGYFIAFTAQPGLASEIIALAGAAGVKLTPAGAPFPYRKDPANSIIRLAPTLPPLGEIEKAVEVFVVSVKLATLRKLAAAAA